MNYNEAEQFLLSLSNLPRPDYMDSRRPHAIALKRMQKFLDVLGNPEKNLPHVIHVAGTSGKGSAVAYLSSILSASGKKTGMMISPHPTDTTERWQINGKPMSEREFENIMEKIKAALDRYQHIYHDAAPSYFEALTAIGFLYFAEQKVDWAVIEVGLGGRYDATNVLPKKDIAVITSIGLDHMELLGSTKAKIAHEKAGIIKPGCRVFTAEKNKKVLAVLQKESNKQKIRLEIPNSKFLISKQGINGINFQYQNERYQIRSLGRHQVKNAILCIDIAHALKIPEAVIKRGLSSAAQPLRMEVMSKNPLTILDGAHNPDKMRTTVSTMCKLTNTKIPSPTIHLIVGFSADKNWKQMLRQLLAFHPASIACTRNTINPFRKVVDPREIVEYLASAFPPPHKEREIQTFLDPHDALAWARTKQKKHDILLITGSIFLSGELRPCLTK